jgi:glyoxylase-like metal-dependent hydrolase (beta-lactamase superfamily II)
MKIISTALILLLTFGASAHAFELEVKQVSQNIYAIVGEMAQRSPENRGNNATFGLVITKAGAVLIDSGGTFKGAEQIDAAIKTVTNKPVKIVINSGGQDHRWLGNDYFKANGARIIASTAAVEDHKERGNGQLEALGFLVGDKGLAGTEAVYADETFDERLSLDFGGVHFELIASGGAHTPGDAVIWLPNAKVAFTGDMVYLERMLGIGDFSNFKNWIVAFEAMAALGPKHIVPGHGNPSTLERATAETYDYLVNLNTRVSKVLENGGEIAEATAVDQEAFKFLRNFDQLARRNAQEVFVQLEFDF